MRWLCKLGLHRWVRKDLPKGAWRRYIVASRECCRCGKEQRKDSVLVSNGKWYEV